ncbi:hypothetical protein An16g04480 [Aspergillus niger]|uniref:Uncharacterized protein n=2 Tax=Aspergillus niger TaxID=5061 RepID=A2R7R7_ASPNC|nr:hypothetical protein An16g04480 [Aspergillus niger]CAK46865.1 hypothetical protein An16g04480 [Aspergillus niger]
MEMEIGRWRDGSCPVKEIIIITAMGVSLFFSSSRPASLESLELQTRTVYHPSCQPHSYHTAAQAMATTGHPGADTIDQRTQWDTK